MTACSEDPFFRSLHTLHKVPRASGDPFMPRPLRSLQSYLHTNRTLHIWRTAERTQYTLMPSRASQTSQHPPNSSPLIQPDLDQILTNGLPSSTWTSPRHFVPTQHYIVQIHAPSLCGAWHTGANNLVVFYLCPKFWIKIDPVKKYSLSLPPQ